MGEYGESSEGKRRKRREWNRRTLREIGRHGKGKERET